MSFRILHGIPIFYDIKQNHKILIYRNILTCFTAIYCYLLDVFLIPGSFE